MFNDSDIEDLFRRTLHLECDEPLRQIENELKQLDEDLGRLGVDGKADSSAPTQPGSNSAAAQNDNDHEGLSREAAIEDLETFVRILDQIVTKTEVETAAAESGIGATSHRTDLLAAFLDLYSGTLRHRFGHVLSEFSEAREATIRLALRLFQLGEYSGSTALSAGDLLLFALGGRDARAQFSVATSERLLYPVLLPRWLASWSDSSESALGATGPSAIDLGEVDPTVLQYLFWNDLRWQKKLLDVVIRSVEWTPTRSDDVSEEASSPLGGNSRMMTLSAIVFCSLGIQIDDMAQFHWIPQYWIDRNRFPKLKRTFLSADHVAELSTILTETLFPSLVTVTRRLLKARALSARDFLSRVYRPLAEQLGAIGTCIDQERHHHQTEGHGSEALTRFPQLLASGLYRLLLCVEEQQKLNIGQPVKRNRILDPTIAPTGRQKEATQPAGSVAPAKPSAAVGVAVAGNSFRETGKISMEDIEVIALQQGLIVRPTDQASSTGQPVHLVLKASDSSNVEFAVPVSYFYVDHVTHTVMFKSKRRDPFQKMEKLQQMFNPKSE